MASWLFGGGGEVDLSAAERAIKQLSEDRDGVKAQVFPLPPETLFWCWVDAAAEFWLWIKKTEVCWSVDEIVSN